MMIWHPPFPHPLDPRMISAETYLPPIKDVPLKLRYRDPLPLYLSDPLPLLRSCPVQTRAETPTLAR
jgi:hypothetical protein